MQERIIAQRVTGYLAALKNGKVNGKADPKTELLAPALAVQSSKAAVTPAVGNKPFFGTPMAFDQATSGARQR